MTTNIYAGGSPLAEALIKLRDDLAFARADAVEFHKLADAENLTPTLIADITKHLARITECLKAHPLPFESIGIVDCRDESIANPHHRHTSRCRWACDVCEVLFPPNELNEFMLCRDCEAERQRMFQDMLMDKEG